MKRWECEPCTSETMRRCTPSLARTCPQLGFGYIDIKIYINTFIDIHQYLSICLSNYLFVYLSIDIYIYCLDRNVVVEEGCGWVTLHAGNMTPTYIEAIPHRLLKFGWGFKIFLEVGIATSGFIVLGVGDDSGGVPDRKTPK